MKKGIKYSLLGLLAVIIIALTGASFYMLGYSLRPEHNKGKDIPGSYEYMLSEYPQIKPWIDSLQTVGALRDTFIINPDGVQLHAIYAAAPEPTHKTAVIVHGYTDDCIRMLMIGYLYNKDLKYNILLPDLQNQGLSGGPAIQMGWKDRLDVLRWMNIANDIYGGNTQMVVHGISMGAATTMMVSGEPQQPFVKCFVEDCGYTSVWDEFSYELKGQFGLPPFPLMYTTSWLCNAKYGWNFTKSGQEMQTADVLHSWRCRYIRAHLDGISPLRGKIGTQRIVACPRCHTRHVLQGSPGGIHRTCEEFCRKIHLLM